MAQLGTVVYTTIKRQADGEPQRPADNVEIITRPNVDGVALRQLETKATPDRFIAEVDIVAATTEALETAIGLHYALRGTIVTMITDNGVTINNIGVLGVKVTVQKSEGGVGGQQGENADYELTVELLLINMNVS